MQQSLVNLLILSKLLKQINIINNKINKFKHVWNYFENTGKLKIVTLYLSSEESLSQFS